MPTAKNVKIVSPVWDAMYNTMQIERKPEPYLPQTYTSCIQVSIIHNNIILYACQHIKLQKLHTARPDSKKGRVTRCMAALHLHLNTLCFPGAHRLFWTSEKNHCKYDKYWWISAYDIWIVSDDKSSPVKFLVSSSNCDSMMYLCWIRVKSWLWYLQTFFLHNFNVSAKARRYTHPFLIFRE